MPDLILSLALLVGVVVAMIGFDSVPFGAGRREPLSDNGLRSLSGR